MIVSRTQGLAPPPNPDSVDEAPVVPIILTEDQRAEQANRLHPLACLLLHASGAGHGVHLFTSALTPPTSPDDVPLILPWNEAQASSVSRSLGLANDLSTAINEIRIPLVLVRASVPPIDSMTCPAVTIELAPLAATPLTDAAYQRRIAEAVVSALTFWRGHVETEAAAAASAAQAAAPAAVEAIPRKSTLPRPPRPPVLAPVLPLRAPALIIRQPPSVTPDHIPPAASGPAR